MFRLAAGRVESGEIAGKAETSAWITRRMNVIVGPEWDDALQICAEYFDSTAGDDPASIAKTLNEIAESLSVAPTANYVPVNENAASDIEPGGSPSEPEKEPMTAEPSKESGAGNCPGGNCSAWPAYRWGWWW